MNPGICAPTPCPILKLILQGPLRICFQWSFSTMWMLGRKTRQRGSKGYLQPANHHQNDMCYHTHSIRTFSSAVLLISILSRHLLHSFSFLDMGSRDHLCQNHPGSTVNRQTPRSYPRTGVSHLGWGNLHSLYSSCCREEPIVTPYWNCLFWLAFRCCCYYNHT